MFARIALALALAGLAACVPAAGLPTTVGTQVTAVQPAAEPAPDEPAATE